MRNSWHLGGDLECIANSTRQPTRECGVFIVGGMVGATGPTFAPVSEASTGIELVISLVSDSLEVGNSFLVAYNQHICGMLVAGRGMVQNGHSEQRQDKAR
jgi:hypothetical protein